jgi:quinol monooxygenase YgiN
MKPIALFVRHKAKPGQRDAMRAVWERYVKPRAASNPGHLEYFFCYDANDPDTVVVFQLYQDQQTMDEFLAGTWYPEYLKAVSKVVAKPPEILPASVIWRKSAGPEADDQA